MQTLGILIAVLTLLVVVFAILLYALMRRTSATQQTVMAQGVTVNGPSASFSSSVHASRNQLFEWVKTIVQEDPRYSGLEQEDGRITFHIRPNVWVWGEVISVVPGLQSSEDVLNIEVACRPRIRTTIYEYGQCGKDLVRFLGQLHDKAGLHPFPYTPVDNTKDGG